MYFVAVDIGATFIKSCRIDQGTLSISNVIRERFPEGSCPPLQEITDKVFVIIQKQLRPKETCQGVFFSNQMHGLVLMDDRGFPVSPFISWQDQRSRNYIKKILDRTKQYDWLSETGERLRIGYPIANLYALKEGGFSLDGLTPVDLGNAVTASLVGAPVVQIEVTNASATGCWDIRRQGWHEGLISALGLERMRWPKVADLNGVQGFLRGTSIPVYFSVGDQQASLLGAGLEEFNQISLNIATGSQVSCLSNKILHGEFQTRPYFNGHYLRTVTHIPAGRALNSVLKLLTELAPNHSLDDIWEQVENKIESVSDSGLAVDLSFFPSHGGEAGAISGITEENFSVGSLMRASFKSICLNHYVAAATLAQESAPRFIVGSGGVLFRSRFLRREVERIFGLPLLLSPSQEDALMGLAKRCRMLAA